MAQKKGKYQLLYWQYISQPQLFIHLFPTKWFKIFYTLAALQELAFFLALSICVVGSHPKKKKMQRTQKRISQFTFE